MSKSMTESNRIPTLYLKDEIDVTQLVIIKFNKLSLNFFLLLLTLEI